MTDPNPYDPPKEPFKPSEAPSAVDAALARSQKRRQNLAMTAMALLSVPAGGAAFFVTCYGTAMVVEEAKGSLGVLIGWSLGLGVVAGALVMGSMLYYGVFRSKRRR